MKALKRFVLRNFEKILVVTLVIAVPLIHFFIAEKWAFLNFYYLPVLVAGYFLGKRKAVLTSILCILLVALVSVTDTGGFSSMVDPKYMGFWNLLVWASFLILLGSVADILFGKERGALARLRNAAKTIASGNVDHRLEVISDDEFGETAEALNVICRNLRESHQNLEWKVEERTRELQESKRDVQATNEQLRTANDEMRQMQAQLLHQEKMASIGQLAAGIAHELNNPIGFVDSNLQTLEKYTGKFTELMESYESLEDNGQPGAEELKTRLQEIEELKQRINFEFIFDDFQNVVQESLEGTDRIKKIVQDLRSFSRSDKEEVVYGNVNDELDRALNFVWPELKYKATVDKNYGDVPDILCNPVQLNQVFMNLLVNAAQAIENRGKIGLTTYSRYDSIWVKIWDTGMGIPEEHLSKIFEPFFTTKDVGQGTGLGLSMVYEIVQKHRGVIEVDSKVGGGTTFTIELPINGGTDAPTRDIVRG